jgi:hypothetical protein
MHADKLQTDAAIQVSKTRAMDATAQRRPRTHMNMNMNMN